MKKYVFHYNGMYIDHESKDINPVRGTETARHDGMTCTIKYNIDPELVYVSFDDGYDLVADITELEEAPHEELTFAQELAIYEKLRRKFMADFVKDILESDYEMSDVAQEMVDAIANTAVNAFERNTYAAELMGDAERAAIDWAMFKLGYSNNL